MISESCEQTYTEQPVAGFWQHLGKLLQRIGKTITRWDQLGQQRQQLREMDDRLLKDIGLSSADVERIAGKRFWDDPLQSRNQMDQRYRTGTGIKSYCRYNANVHGQARSTRGNKKGQQANDEINTRL